MIGVLNTSILQSGIGSRINMLIIPNSHIKGVGVYQLSNYRQPSPNFRRLRLRVREGLRVENEGGPPEWERGAASPTGGGPGGGGPEPWIICIYIYISS